MNFKENFLVVNLLKGQIALPKVIINLKNEYFFKGSNPYFLRGKKIEIRVDY